MSVEVFGDGESPLIPEDSYEAVIRRADVRHVFNAVKLRLILEVRLPNLGSDEARTVLLPRYYNLRLVAGRRLKAGPASNYWREFALVTGRRPSRNDRMAPSRLLNALVVVDVRTVTESAPRNGRPGRRLPAHATYSVVDAIVDVVAGGGPRP